MNIIEKGLAVLDGKTAIIRLELEKYLTGLLLKNDYTPVYSPHIGDIKLFETSGHYPYYKAGMFPPILEEGEEKERFGGLRTEIIAEYILKPMSCPFHIQAYNAIPRSYKALPLRLFEFGTVYRHEASGSLNGLLRLRGFTQDDGHIFCTQDQIQKEVNGCIRLILEIGKKFGLTIKHKLSLSDGNCTKYIGDGKAWQVAEEALRSVVPSNTEIEEGGAAFYGPKIDFSATDSLGREWQLGTVQLDFNLPERFKLEFRNDKNELKEPVLIHRALLGSLERFIAILLEQWGDNIPIEFALEQFRIIPVHSSLELRDYANRIKDALSAFGWRVKVDEEEAPLRAKIKNANDDHVPLFGVVGDKDLANGTISIDNVPWATDVVITQVISLANKKRLSSSQGVLPEKS